MGGSVHFLDGGGEMGKAIREHDWAGNELGPPDGWPSALKIALGMALNSKFPKCIVWGPGLIALHNDAFRPILGDKDNTLGRAFSDVWREVWPEIGPIAERAYAGEATFIEDFPLVVNRYGYPEECHFTFCYSPIRDESGVVRGMIDTVIETTGKVQASRQLRLINGELGHRIKNTLTVVSAIVNQTLQSHTGQDARDILRQRIGALAQAQSLLTDSSALDAEIGQVIQQALTPFRTGQRRFRISGPPVRLSAKQALTLALAINELATNALKYGALSVPQGAIDLSWTSGRPHSDDPFRLIWAESDGPPVACSTGKGFGSLIIEHVLAQDFMGESVISHRPQGLCCELRTKMNCLGVGPSAQT
ncbi:PAS domain-containing protein [Paracoccus methylovorus]|uniref:histidine kinase n=2 Tax=Paracoccus TaxID=265 RepID=A0ABX7JD25_9RHOB|nr:PAS domain-containing sensor histidine kinase [Paracoccus methylovorus]QRZ12137.1 PAS domain-containing protein [Paracoccus methylovorus]